MMLRDHRHRGLFPVGEAIESELEYSDEHFLKRYVKNVQSKKE